MSSGKQTDVLEHINNTKQKVLEILKRINMDKSPALDQVYPNILWEEREENTGALAEIFAFLIVTGEAPES